MNDQQNPQNTIEIELPETEAMGSYSNLVMITHSESEFILDFISMMPGLPKAKVMKRIIMSPSHVKRLSDALKDNIRKYEAQFGTIEVDAKNEFPMNYRGPIPQA
jgi:hypothetical protein